MGKMTMRMKISKHRTQTGQTVTMTLPRAYHAGPGQYTVSTNAPTLPTNAPTLPTIIKATTMKQDDEAKKTKFIVVDWENEISHYCDTQSEADASILDLLGGGSKITDIYVFKVAELGIITHSIDWNKLSPSIKVADKILNGKK